MRCVLLGALAGCGFSGPPVNPGGPATADATIASGVDATTWTTLEVLVIPTTTLTVVASMHSLTAGATYRLRASGTIACDTHGSPADAEYFIDYPSQQWMDVYNGAVDVGLGIDDATNDAKKSPAWGPRTANHEYEVMYTGQGRPLAASYHDVQYSNNTGALMLEIDAR